MLMMEKLLLEADITAAAGVITEEQDIIWSENSLALKDKLDSYGYLLDELDAEKKKLADIKVNGVERVQAAQSRIDDLQKKLKDRLNHFANESGGALRGHIYSFHPFLSKHSYVNDVEQLSANEIYLTIEIRQDYWQRLLDAEPTDSNIAFSIKKRVGKVSELPDNHPAVVTVCTPSVRVT